MDKSNPGSSFYWIKSQEKSRFSSIKSQETDWFPPWVSIQFSILLTRKKEIPAETFQQMVSCEKIICGFHLINWIFEDNLNI